MKVGICVEKFQKTLFANGVRFNSLLWYDFLKNCDFDVSFISTMGNEEFKETEENKNTFHARMYKKYKVVNLNKIWENENTVYKLKKDYKELYPDLFDYDYIFLVGLFPDAFCRVVQENGTKLILVELGSTYHNDVNDIVQKKNVRKHYAYFDQVWISPHFKFTKEYMKFKYNTEHVYVCPYFWRDDLFIEGEMNTFVEKNVDLMRQDPNNPKLNVAIVEPNLELSKNCLIPLGIVNKAQKHISTIYAFNTLEFKTDSYFNSFVSSLLISLS